MSPILRDPWNGPAPTDCPESTTGFGPVVRFCVGAQLATNRGRFLSATPEIGGILPVTIRGEVPGRAMRGGARIGP
ncbi:MAG: hypothetical protein E5V72_07460 [Mesorhizobium sp.]|nr:MAG: hypothetical protein E5V72_07460 [Mesorhizobium sp.]